MSEHTMICATRRIGGGLCNCGIDTPTVATGGAYEPQPFQGRTETTLPAYKHSCESYVDPLSPHFPCTCDGNDHAYDRAVRRAKDAGRERDTLTTQLRDMREALGAIAIAVQRYYDGVDAPETIKEIDAFLRSTEGGEYMNARNSEGEHDDGGA